MSDLHSSNIDHDETFEVHLCLILLVVIDISDGSEVCPADRMWWASALLTWQFSCGWQSFGNWSDQQSRTDRRFIRWTLLITFRKSPKKRWTDSSANVDIQSNVKHRFVDVCLSVSCRGLLPARHLGWIISRREERSIIDLITRISPSNSLSHFFVSQSTIDLFGSIILGKDRHEGNKTCRYGDELLFFSSSINTEVGKCAKRSLFHSLVEVDFHELTWLNHP